MYGGIERHVEELGARLVERGHRVTVFGRKPFSRPGEHRGIDVAVLPSIPTKNLDTASNVLATTLRVLFDRFDIVHYHGVGPSLFAWMPAATGERTVATIHALDYRQSKWGPAARALLRLGERTAVERCHAVIAVSKLMAEELAGRYGRRVVYIPNGAALAEPPPFREAASLGLSEGRYILAVGRFIVERGFHTLLEAYRHVKSDMRLVIAGDAYFDGAYGKRLRSLADGRVVFPGHIRGTLLAELYAHCAFYVLPSTVEGLSISLLEAMSFGRPVLVSDIPENLEVASEIAVTFRGTDARDLVRAMEELLAMREDERSERGRLARERVRREYSWDRVTDSVESLYLGLVHSRR